MCKGDIGREPCLRADEEIFNLLIFLDASSPPPSVRLTMLDDVVAHFTPSGYIDLQKPHSK